MNFSPIGDLAQSLMMRRRGNALRQDLSALTQELSTGQSRDLASRLRGNFSTISAVEHSLKLQDGYTNTRNTVGQIFDFSQQALGAMQGLVDDIGPMLLSVANSGSQSQIDPIVAKGPGLFQDLVAHANTQHAGRYVFAGTAFDTKPIADPDAMLADIAAATAGANTAADFTLAIDDWFENPVSGYQISGYSAGNPASGRLEISSSQSIKFEITAKDEAFRDAFKHAATLALVKSGDFAGSAAEKQALMQTAGAGLMKASNGLLAVQADIGASQQRVETSQSQASLETQMLKAVKNEIVTVDPYEVATKLEAVQTQLESLYLVTARTSRLNLSEYLR